MRDDQQAATLQEPDDEARHVLRIRKEQFAAFRTLVSDAFADQLLDDIRQETPDVYEERGPAALRALIERGLQKAERYAIRKRADIADFIDWMLELGEDFESSSTYDWALPILEDEGLNGSAKLAVIEERLAEEEPASTQD